MQDDSSINLKRACDAIQIPVGNAVVLPAGTSVNIAQTLGGSITVHSMGGLFRIAGKDADALGLEPMVAPLPAAIASDKLEEKIVWDTLKTCYDPEIPVNIVDLGLVYDMGIEPLPAGGNKVFVKMTLTAPGCGMGPAIARDAQQKILELPTVQDASVEVVWDPPWHQSMITEEGRKVLGLA
jgi:probable FeS assembly SUF system protein SufT